MPVLSRAAATLIAVAALNVTTLHAAPGSGPEGVWLDHTGRGAVEIKPCGDKLCGHVVWVKSAADAKGCGRQIIGDAKAAGRAVHSGWIYSPERGKRYNVELTPMTDGRLKVLGYAGTKLFSKTMYWSPAAADLQRCDATAKTAPQTAAVPPPKPAQATTATVQSQAAKAVQPQPATPTVAAPVAAPQPQAATPPAPAKAATAAPTQPKPGTTPPSAQTAAPSQPEPAQPAAENAEQDSAQAPDASEEDSGPPRRLARILDQVLKRSADGDCKLDLPWVKVEFDCDQH